MRSLILTRGWYPWPIENPPTSVPARFQHSVTRHRLGSPKIIGQILGVSYILNESFFWKAWWGCAPGTFGKPDSDRLPPGPVCQLVIILWVWTHWWEQHLSLTVMHQLKAQAPRWEVGGGRGCTTSPRPTPGSRHCMSQSEGHACQCHLLYLLDPISQPGKTPVRLFNAVICNCLKISLWNFQKDDERRMTCLLPSDTPLQG